MAHLHTDDDWANAKLSRDIVDLFECKKCKIEFSLDSDKIEGKKIYCPLCKKSLKAWQKRWESI